MNGFLGKITGTRSSMKTGCGGFHYLHHERTENLFPPDGSHLMPKEAGISTRDLARFVFKKKG